MRKKIPLKKMSQADVTFVSMVGRSANRIPFRVIKSDKENGMGINLGSLGKVLKGERQAPAVEKPELVAVVVEKSDLLPQVTDAIKEVGLVSDNVVENEDNTITFIQKEAEEGEDLTLIRMDENTVVVMKGFSAYSSDLKDFNEIVKAQGFYQGLCAATDAFRETITKSMYEVDNADELVKKVDATTNSFGQYVRSLAAGLPKTAFYVSEKVSSVYKAAKEVPNGGQGDKAPAKAPEGVAQADWDTMSETEKGGWLKKNKAKKEDETPKEEDKEDLTVVPDTIAKADWVAKSDDEKREYLKAQKAEVVEKSDETPQAVNVDEIVQKTAAAVSLALKGTIDGLTEKVDTLTADNAKLKETVDSVVQKSDAVAAKVGATVVNAVVKQDEPSNTSDTQVKKGDEDQRTGAFDTAMIRKSSRR